MAQGAVSRWQQGSVVPADLLRKLRADGHVPTSWVEQDIAVVITHSCDLQNHHAASEPTVELLRGQVIPVLEGNFAHAKNPRTMDIEWRDGTANTRLRFQIVDRIVVPRESVLGSPPPMKALPDLLTKQIARWVGKRYWRQAFPDAFNERVRPVQSALRTSLRKAGVWVSGIYVAVETSELPSNIPYSVDLVATMRREDFEIATKRDAVQGAIDQFAAILDSADGIEMNETTLVSEAQISLDDLRILMRWDYDDLSVRGAEAAMAPDDPA